VTAYILTDDQGRPFPEIESPLPGAPIEDVIAFLRAITARNDAITTTSSGAFARQFGWAMCRVPAL
jgi:hypothetical protein